MALRKYKPTTAGTRWRVGNAYTEITTNVPEKSLVEKVHHTAGATDKVAEVCATLVADTKGCTVLLILKEIKKIFRLL
jgi:ribosomal protein L2